MKKAYPNLNEKYYATFGGGKGISKLFAGDISVPLHRLWAYYVGFQTRARSATYCVVLFVRKSEIVA